LPVGSSNAGLTKRYIDDDQPIIKGKYAALGWSREKAIEYLRAPDGT